MNICIQYSYHKPAPECAGEVIGLDVAVTDFLRAWFRHGDQETFIALPADDISYDHFKEIAAQEGIDPLARCKGLNPDTPQHNLTNIDCIFRPDPALADLAWRRQQLPAPSFATCGLVHTMSGHEVAAAITDLCLAPTDGNDVLICPSRAIADTVHRFWENQSAYFNHRFKGSFQCPVRTTIVPLGINTAKFEQKTTPENRRSQREKLGINDDEIVILFVGRLSFATKAHPLPLMLAAEQAAQRTDKKLRLVLMGYFKPSQAEADFRALAAAFCHKIKIDFILNNDERFPDGLWACADIFASLVENVQESFGLTPVEAMASGLPVIATDWDGYRDSIRHGEEGYLIQTMMPPAFAGLELAQDYYNTQNYGSYLVGSSQSTAIDIKAAADAIVTLAEDPEKRRLMGAKGRERARTVYDWRHIIATYKAIWSLIAQEKKQRGPTKPLPEHWPAAHPHYPNPWDMFQSFPSHRIGPNDTLRQAPDPPSIKDVLAHPMNFFAPELLLDADRMDQLFQLVGLLKNPRIAELQSHFTTIDQARLWRCIGWLLKHGLCVLERNP